MLIIIDDYFWAFSTSLTALSRSSPSIHLNNLADKTPKPTKRQAKKRNTAPCPLYNQHFLPSKIGFFYISPL
ncbi:hypothetical protein CPY64_12860 [Alcaligenes faecalis]|nr:hypothetical protein CPY64_12860 [Alcaligenes faecalis]